MQLNRRGLLTRRGIERLVAWTSEERGTLGSLVLREVILLIGLTVVSCF